MSNKCDICGRFRKKEHLCGVSGEGSDQWIECIFCMPESDLNTFFKNDPEIIELAKLGDKGAG